MVDNKALDISLGKIYGFLVKQVQNPRFIRMQLQNSVKVVLNQ